MIGAQLFAPMTLRVNKEIYANRKETIECLLAAWKNARFALGQLERIGKNSIQVMLVFLTINL
ncbi:hypothetical protein AZF04_02700 [Alkalihalobacillus trypoxylicola]|uniref:Uncharacterized protein n=1 Tax=Alkalihalobacillus trypoxylicola TaxID=519424 RepID=A0A162FC71_9BACI|nr:hypothetical protein AZF04_02700 [Alkalihalobacillus trypoxylicola]